MSNCEPPEIHARDSTWMHMNSQGSKQEGVASQESKTGNYPCNERLPNKYAQLH